MTVITFRTSDHALAHRVTLALRMKDPRLADITVDVTGPDIVHLSGRVSSFYLRQLALAIARHVAGVRQISDGIQVTPPIAVKKPR